LGERVEIKTRHKREKSIQIDITSEWLAEQGAWDLPIYEVPDLDPGCTLVDVSKLRQSFTPEDVESVRTHLSETYDWYLRNGCEIRLNGTAVPPTSFEKWAYPPGFEPQEATLQIYPTVADSLTVSIVGGLIVDRDPEKANYGVYVYCNDRLVVKETANARRGVLGPRPALCLAAGLDLDSRIERPGQ
jgi:hypothetical protein